MPDNRHKLARDAAHQRIYQDRVAANASAPVDPAVRAFLDKAKARRNPGPAPVAKAPSAPAPVVEPVVEAAPLDALSRGKKK